MKRLTKLLVLIISLFISTNVYAKDTVYSINKYDDEEYSIIKESYNKNNKKDGLITSGTFLKEQVEKDENEYDNNQIVLVKYKTNGKVSWTYRYGRTSSENITDLIYSYDENNNINGYIMIVNNSYDILTSNDPKSYFVKIDLDGKLVEEKEIGLNQEEIINKLIPTYKIDNVIDGYIGITNTSIVKFDKELNLIQKKVYQNSNYKSINYTDITNLYDDNNIVGYVFIRKLEIDTNKYDVELLKYNKDLTEEKVLENINNYNSYYLSEANNGFILYGLTDEVKVKKGDYSYYITNYKIDGETAWETIGTTAVEKDSNIVIYPSKDKEIKKYFLLYKNNDKSNEVVKLDNEGTIENKIKKINNDYYNFKSFLISNNEKEIYFVGNITCPKDDKCDYNTNSLLLISGEDKVIEVQDSTSQNILLGIVVLIGLIGISVYLTKRKQLNIDNKKRK